MAANEKPSATANDGETRETPFPPSHNPFQHETPQDTADRQKAREHSEHRLHHPWWKRIGPGLITGAADDDPSGIGTYSVAGAQFGYGMLWLIPYMVPLMIAVQEMCGRIGSITGKGLAAVIKEHYPRWILYVSVLLLCVANTMNVWADLNVMAASAQMAANRALHQSNHVWQFYFWLTLLTIVTISLLILVPYRRYVRLLKWLCLALLAYVVVAFWPGVHHNWGASIIQMFRPRWSNNPAYIMTVVGFIGTTISPYLFFWQAGETVEEEVAEGKAAEPGRRLRAVTDEEIRAVRADTIVGMLASQVITFFIVISCKSTLFDKGIRDINTAQDAAQALLPLGPLAYWLFTLGIIGTGLLAIPTLAGSAAYAIAETAGWRYGLYRSFRRARGFYFTIAGVIVVGFLLNFVNSISPLKALLYSAVLNGVVAPPLIVMLLLICNNAKIVGTRRNGPISNVLGWATVILMTLAAGFMFWAMATGKAS